MPHRILIRIILGLVLLISILQGWGIAAALLFILGAWLYPLYIEGLIAGLAYDALFGVEGLRSHAGILVSLLIFFIIYSAKRIVRK